MGDLSERDVEDILGGVQPPGRDDLKPVVDLAAWMHASREIEPPPAMRDQLFEQIEGEFEPFERTGRRSPAHMASPYRAGRRRRLAAALSSSGRPIVSLAAAATLLVGVILAVRTGDPGAGPGAVTSQPVAGFPDDGAEPTTTAIAPTTTPSADAYPADERTGESSPTTTATLPTTGGSVPPTTDSSRATTHTGSGRSPGALPPAGQPAPGEADRNDVPDGESEDGWDSEHDADDDDGAGRRSPSEAPDESTSDQSASGSFHPWWPPIDLSRWLAPDDSEAWQDGSDAAPPYDRRADTDDRDGDRGDGDRGDGDYRDGDRGDGDHGDGDHRYGDDPDADGGDRDDGDRDDGQSQFTDDSNPDPYRDGDGG